MNDGEALPGIGHDDPGQPAINEPTTDFVSPEAEAAHLRAVRLGMHVMDATGRVIGRVAEIKLADPEAASDWGEEPRPTVPSFLGALAAALAHPRAQPPSGEQRDRLIHEGYLLLDTKGVFHRDRFIEADQIEAVGGDLVRLSVDFEQLTET